MKKIAQIFMCLISSCAFSLAADIDASDLGFLPNNDAKANTQALQKAVENGGTIRVTKSGVYDVCATVLLPSNTELIFSQGVSIRKVCAPKPFTHVFLNKGALTKTFDSHIRIEGLNLIVNKVDVCEHKVYGLRGHLAFFYVKDLRIERFRCFDFESAQYCIHVCTFEDVIIDDAIVEGKKDGIHLGRGKRFKISNCSFKTYDDAVALNAHDYSTGNPELGLIEDGIVENCTDRDDEDNKIGYFCRILAGSWCDWREGMSVQQSDTVVSNGKLYRVQMNPDGTKYVSKTRPTHEKGQQVLDGIKWGVVQNDIAYIAAVRNVIFKDIFLYKPRLAFSIHFDNGRYSRSYYPDSPIPEQKNVQFENVNVMHDKKIPFISTVTPIDTITMRACNLANNTIFFGKAGEMKQYPPTSIKMLACTFNPTENLTIFENAVHEKKVNFFSCGSTVLNEKVKILYKDASATGKIDTDLPLQKIK